MRSTLFNSLVWILLVGTTAHADFFIKVHDVTAQIPASGSTVVSVPVSLEITGGVPGNLLLNNYDIAMNVVMGPGVSFTDEPPTGPTNGDGTTGLLPGFPVDSNTAVNFASIGIGATASNTPTVPNITSSSTNLFTIDFVVESTASPQMVTFSLPMPAVSNFPLFQFIDDPATAGIDETMDVANVPLSPDSGKLTLTAVPEPSEWILAFLCLSSGMVVLSKKWRQHRIKT